MSDLQLFKTEWEELSKSYGMLAVLITKFEKRQISAQEFTDRTKEYCARIASANQKVQETLDRARGQIVFASPV